MRSVLTSSFILICLALTAAAQSVIVTGKKVTYKRLKPQMDYKKSFVINYPTIKGTSPLIARRIERSLSYELNFNFTLREELRDLQWLEEADYEVLYNKNGVLCVQMYVEGSAAYPSGSTRNVTIDLDTGKKLNAPDVFTNLQTLTGVVRKMQQKEIADSIVEIKKDPENGDRDPKELFARTRFTTKDLNGFSVDDKGVTFVYEYGFPHVVQALQPSGRFSFSWREIKPYIRKDGPFARIHR